MVELIAAGEELNRKIDEIVKNWENRIWIHLFNGQRY